MDLEAVILPLFFFWIVGLVFTLFRSGIEWFWKIPAVLISVFYGIWFRTELAEGFSHFRDQFGLSMTAFLNAMGHTLGLGLLLFWPVVLLYTGYAASSGAARGFLRFMVILTLFYWIFWFVNYFVYPIPVEALGRLLPERIHFELPRPPAR